MSDLAAFQDRFSQALHLDGDLRGNGDAEALRIGLSVHRNTVYKALIDALRANYPTVERTRGRGMVHCQRIRVFGKEPSRRGFFERVWRSLSGFPDYAPRYRRIALSARSRTSGPTLDRGAYRGGRGRSIFGSAGRRCFRVFVSIWSFACIPASGSDGSRNPRRRFGG